MNLHDPAATVRRRWLRRSIAAGAAIAAAATAGTGVVMAGLSHGQDSSPTSGTSTTDDSGTSSDSSGSTTTDDQGSGLGSSSDDSGTASGGSNGS